MSLTPDQIQAADRLDDARRTGKVTTSVAGLIGTTNLGSAYEVNAELNRRRLAAGGVMVGRKVGLTSRAVQERLGLVEPTWGTLFADMALKEGSTLAAGILIQPKVEGEVAFILGDDLDRKITYETVRGAVARIAPAIEVVDSRIENWNIVGVDAIADYGTTGAFVIGAASASLADIDPRAVKMELKVNGHVKSSGDGTACLGDPLEALYWLAGAALAHGQPLRAGEVVLSGALGPMVPVVSGSTVEADLGVLGKVTLAFAE